VLGALPRPSGWPAALLRFAGVAAVLPLTLLIPAIAAGLHVDERRFGARLFRLFQAAEVEPPEPRFRLPRRLRQVFGRGDDRLEPGAALGVGR
jgi:hypothetical protein